MNNYEKKINGINICINYKTELLGIILSLSDYYMEEFGYFCDDSFNNYITDIRNRFSEYKDDNVITDMEKIIKSEFCNDQLVSLFLQLDNKFNCNGLDNYLKSCLYNGLTEDDIIDFCSELDVFSKKIGFNEYYQSNKEKYNKYIDNISNVFEDNTILDYLSNYFGINNKKSTNMLLLPWYTNAGCSVDTDNDIYACCGTYRDDTKEGDLYEINDSNKTNLLLLVVHEFSHSYVNPLTDEFGLCREDSSLFDDIDLSFCGYPTDVEKINEHIVRAVEHRYVHNKIGNDDLVESLLSNDEDIGFKYIRDVYSDLEVYENNRDLYPSFKEFYPVIVNDIRTKKDKNNKL